jgi:hypothetical protein
MNLNIFRVCFSGFFINKLQVDFLFLFKILQEKANMLNVVIIVFLKQTLTFVIFYAILML